MLELRDYQNKAVSELRKAILNGQRKPVLVLPTGAGKSVIFGQIIKNAADKYKTVLWLVHRRNLVTQMAETLEKKFGIKPGIIMAGYESKLSRNVQLCTIQTYFRRLKLGERFFIGADIVLIDEAHRSLSRTFSEIHSRYHSKIIIGCTATPQGPGGRGMGERYDSILDIVGVKHLTDQGHLSKFRYFAHSKPDLTGVKIVRGDYEKKELGKRHNTKILNGDIVRNWLKNGEDRKTIAFCVNVKHSLSVRDEFLRNGVAAEHLQARSNDDERDQVFRNMEDGKTRVVCNVGLYQEGLDVPDVSCVILARSMKILGMYRQCGGRGSRISGIHDDCLIFDHGGVVEEHGFLDDEYTWELDGKVKKQYDKKKEKKEKKKCKCTSCNMVFEALAECPDCGSPVQSFGQKIETTDEDLEELKKVKQPTMAEKRRYYGMLRYWVAQKRYNPKMITAKYKTKFDRWPSKEVKGTEPIKPDQTFLNLMKHDFIRYAKRRNQ